MDAYFAEFVGTAILILLGNGVVANVLLADTKGHQAGWIVITAGWSMAVFAAVLCVGQFSGAHINPAVTIGTAVAGKFSWGLVPGYIIAQMLGGIVGGALVYFFYQPHYSATQATDLKLATFCTAPNIRRLPWNLFCEAVATFVLIYAVLLMADPTFSIAETSDEVTIGLGSIGALPVALIVLSIGLSLGGTTGYAINPARDLGPRLAHAILPIPGKGDNDWAYAPIPVLGPILGAIAAALLYRAQELLGLT